MDDLLSEFVIENDEGPAVLALDRLLDDRRSGAAWSGRARRRSARRQDS